MVSGGLGPVCRSIEEAAGFKLLKLGKVSDGHVENWSFSHHCREDHGILAPRTIDRKSGASLIGFYSPLDQRMETASVVGALDGSAGSTCLGAEVW